MRRAILCVVGLLLMAHGGAVADDETKAGRRYPSLRLPTIDGKQTIAIHELRGKKVLLIEFASW